MNKSIPIVDWHLIIGLSIEFLAPFLFVFSTSLFEEENPFILLVFFPEKINFHSQKMIRMSEAPKKVEVHFVKNDIDPTGLGGPLFPPVFAAVSNALYQATGRRLYNQPFMKELESGITKM
jgi:hypothetical protein